MVCFKLKYNFSKIKDKKYNLFYKDKIIEKPKEIHSGFIYIIYDEINEEFKNDFKLKIIEIEKVEKEIEEEEKKKIEKEDDKIIEKEVEIIEKKINNYIKFSEAKKLNFYKYKIKNEEDIKKNFKKEIKAPTKKDIYDPPEILLNGNKQKIFFNIIYLLKKSLNNLNEIFNEIKDKQISENLFDKFESEIKEVKNNIIKIKEIININKNNYKVLFYL